MIYSFKDYTLEAQKIEALLKQKHPSAQSILDIACGTAEHAKHLSKNYRIDGIDFEAGFVSIAQNKNPSGHYWQADMSDFELTNQSYDVIQCLFSSIGYLKHRSQIVSALNCFKKHLNPGGLILIEPWFTPEQWKGNQTGMLTVDKPDLKICRMSQTRREGNCSQLIFHYLIGDAQGIEHVTENHALFLYTQAEMQTCFEKANLHVSYDPVGIFGRGLYIAHTD